MNTRLQYALLTLSLAGIMTGCGTTSDSDPLVPEIASIEIDGTDTDSSIHAIVLPDDENQLSATVFYDDNSSSSNVTYQLDWDSNDTTVMEVQNGLLTPTANRGTAAISASFRNKLFTTIDKKVTIIPLNDINITSEDINITYATDKNSANVYTGSSYTLKANGTFDDNQTTVDPISSNIQWSSSNTTIATIDSTGLLTVQSTAGIVDINVSVYDEINSTLELNVTVQ
ncbi:Ig-like domain-containing protein [Sulfurimonas sp. HSL3-7]|uniref:Ig-like domain-containing protein n=1 Tax=Sulfonitrofixus jiaomeiensis TaxID=3131938 RepID=UPI0031F7CF27